MINTTQKINAQLGGIFYQFAKNSSYAYWIRSADFRRQFYINHAFENLWGYSCDQLYRNPELWIETVVKEDRDRIRQHFLDVCENKLTTMEYQINAASGKIIPIKETSMPIFDKGRCIAFIGMAMEAAPELPSDYQDRASEFFRYFIEKSDTIFWVRDRKNKHPIYINSAYEKIWGKSRESLTQNPDSWYDLVHPDDRAKVGMQLVNIADKENDRLYSQRFRIVKENGEIRWVREKSYLMYNKQGEAIACAGTVEDITEDMFHESELRQAKENAEKANKTKSDFLAMMSHELRTPLNAILGMAQILRQSKLNKEQEGQVDVITLAGKNLLSLLNDILDFTKLEVGKLRFSRENLDLLYLINQLMSDMLPLAKKKQLTLTYTIDRDVERHLIGDARRVQQVLSNLLSNAIKYTKKGFVKLKVTSLQRNNKETALCFTVEDSGIGIEKSKIDSIFRRFQQIESVYQRQHGGVGLGLAIVKELVEHMGGSTAVSSELGVGSQFSCIIPFGLQSRELERQSTNLAPLRLVKEPQFNLHVLVVEDNKINQKIAKMMLEQIGCRVDVAENAEQALSMNYSIYDMIFMDLGLPNMDGFQATQQIRSHEGNTGHRIPIVAMTAHVFMHDQERCFQVGMDEVVAKPIMRDDLIAVVGRFKECFSDVR